MVHKINLHFLYQSKSAAKIKKRVHALPYNLAILPQIDYKDKVHFAILKENGRILNRLTQELL